MIQKVFWKFILIPLIIDEAQRVPELFPEIEAIVNRSRLERGNKESNGMYILSVSCQNKLVNYAKESLSGRVCILDMNNLSLNEILKMDNLPFYVDLITNSNRAKRYTINETQAFQYIIRGFFPVLYDDLDLRTQSFYSSI